MNPRLALGLALLVTACSNPPRRHLGDDDERPDAVDSNARAEASASATAVPAETAVATAEAAPSSSASAGRYAVRGPADSPDPHVARQAALRDAMEFGMIGLGSSMARPSAAPSGSNMWGGEIGDAYGAGGLGLSGVGEGGGKSEGIGLGSIGTIGRRSGTGSTYGVGGGSGRLGSARATKPPSVRMGATSVTGTLPPEVIQRIVRQNFGRFRLCYENGLAANPALEGRVTISFTIKPDGSVGDVKSSGDLPDKKVVDCVARAFWGLSFPQPEKGSVMVSYPISFAPGDPPPKTESPDPAKPAVTSPTVNGKVLAEVTAVDVEKALRDAGCTDVSSKVKEGTRIVVFSATKDKHTFTISFVPASAGASALSADDLADFSKRGAITKRDGAFFIAVESDDKAASRALLDGIVKIP